MCTTPNRAAWLHGADGRCNITPLSSTYPRRLVLLGAPGVGKGTQAELLAAYTGGCHLSTGDIFRAARQSDCASSPAMQQALGYMKRGELVPDATVLDIMRERVGCLRCRGGFLLDGFPRTVAQASALEALLAHENLQLDAVIDYRLPRAQIIERLSGRRTCPNCKAVFHITTNPPKIANICDHCGAALIQREDDRAEAVGVRMDAYDRSTRPLTDFYTRLGILVAVEAVGSPQDVFKRTVEALEARV
jgi:adenylate kinase